MHDDGERESEGAPSPVDARWARDWAAEPVVRIDPLANEAFDEIRGDAPAESHGGALRLPRSVGDETLTGVLARFNGFIRGTAWQLAWYDRDLRDDLEQEGRVALWRLDPVRLAAAHHPSGYRRAVIRRAMTRYLRTLSRQNPGDRRIDWRVVQEVVETFGERRRGGREAA